MFSGFFSHIIFLVKFFYLIDIFLIGDSVMSYDASNIDLPIKLLIPLTSLNPYKGFGHIGLGDIIIPGLLIAYTHKFD